MNEEMQNLMDSNLEWYKDLQYQDVKIYIKDNINSASRSFVAIGYYLKYVRDNQLFLEDNYNTIWEFAQGEFSIGKSSASSFMSINDKFSVDGNSPILLEQYRDFTSSKLAEMLTLSEEQLEQVTPVTTRAEIRGMKQPIKEVDTVLHAEQKAEELKTIDNLDLSVTTYNCLKRAGIDVIDELCDLTEDDVIKIRNMGRKCLDEINEKLSEVGRGLKQNHQLPRCTHEADTECNMINIKPIAESLGMDCNGNCCWGCKELCGARCNASAHRPAEIEPASSEEPQPCKFDGGKCDLWLDPSRCSGSERCDSNFIADVEPVETVEADIIETEYEDDNDDEDEPEIIDPEYYTYRDVDDELDKLMGYVETFRKDNDNSSGRRKAKMRLDAIILLDRDMRKVPVVEETEPEQPELPILRNNDQRKDFIDAYATWPIWIDTEQTGERYYRYNLSDKVAMVVKVSRKHSYQGYKETKDYEYGAEQYYLLGVKTEWHSGKTEVIEDDTRTFYECSTNKSALVDYLKEIQKKGG